MNLEQQVEVLYSLKKTDERRANRILHHCQTAMYWLVMLSFTIVSIVLGPPDKSWVWIVQLVLDVVVSVSVLMGPRPYLLWPDIQGHYDDCE